MDAVQQAWQNRRMLRWTQTQWCNYRCSYCRQDHARKQTYRGGPGHWADAAPPGTWFAALIRHFSDKQLSIAITGGEPMLDRRNMQPLLQALCDAPWVDAVRVDTNASWEHYEYTPHPKLLLMCSYHPEHVTADEFLLDIQRLQGAGYSIAMVTLVVTPDRFDLLDDFTPRLARLGVPLNANPVYGNLNSYTPEQVDRLRKYVSPADWHYRTGGETLGRTCLYPSLSYEMQPDGQLCVACHPHLRGSIWEASLPAPFPTYIPCPHSSCTCLDRYTFSMGVNTDATPLQSYARRLPLVAYTVTENRSEEHA